ncbi:MAG: translation elongation factor Ts [Candidatus Babeliales bacterium]
MAKIDKELIQKLRSITGLGLLDCQKALIESDGDIEKAIDWLRIKGAAFASKRSDRKTSEGIVHSYIHPGSQIGVLIEVNCETDFVARTEDFKTFAHDLCLHIAALKPLYLHPDDVDVALIEREKNIIKEQLADSRKPEKIIEQIIEGKIAKLYEEICLLKQSFIKNDLKTVAEVLQELIAKTGENIVIRRFACFVVSS